MKALIMRHDVEAAAACAQALIKKGFQVVCVENRHIARALLRIETIDLLVMDERVDGRLTHSIALSAERRHPYINAILMTDKPAEDADELYDLIPSLYALAGIDISATVLGQLAISSIEDYEQARMRVGRNAAADLAEAALAPDPIWEDELVDEIVLTTQEDVDVPLYSDVAQAIPALAQRPQKEDEDDDLTVATQNVTQLPYFAALGGASAGHLARISRATDGRAAAQ